MRPEDVKSLQDWAKDVSRKWGFPPPKEVVEDLREKVEYGEMSPEQALEQMTGYATRDAAFSLAADKFLHPKIVQLDRWDRHFIELALMCARMSKDPNTQVGAVIVGPDREVRSTGFNGFPRGIDDTADRLNNKETKLSLILHAEVNAILHAARVGVSVKGCALYLVATDSTGNVWGGPPCINCALNVIQAGIVTVRALPFKPGPSAWAASTQAAGKLLAEAGVRYEQLGSA